MAFRQVTSYTKATSSRPDSFLKVLSSTTPRYCLIPPSATCLFNQFPSQTRPIYVSSASKCGQRLLLEGIQGPLSALPTLKESRKILENAVKEANVGFSQQGIQGYRHSTQQTYHSSAGLSTQVTPDWDMEDTACPQGVQGSTDGDDGPCSYFSAWRDNCRRYGLSDCDQQVQGIQSGRLTLAQVLAEQEALIAEIAENYRKRVTEHPLDAQDESLQGAQGDMELPAVDSPCPQGVQGEDCVQFKLWLDNCHRFGLHQCLQQLQGLQSGRLTLAQIFEEQEATIREVVKRYQKQGN
ncbi:uncharacterized protein LOC143300126 [Babylonia areolata]|uniref:uncharacterized protein LOC143300126 n=1 Tax=Babylonia areolata TaxID=304850 RepID=UPI003FD68083